MAIADTPGPSRYHSDSSGHPSGQPSGQRHSHARATLPTAARFADADPAIMVGSLTLTLNLRLPTTARFADADPTIKVGPIGRLEHLALFLGPRL